MRAPKPLSKDRILNAMEKTRSVRAAARYLNCSYPHTKKWMKFYDATEEGYANLFEQHKNQCGKGIPKYLKSSGKDPALIDIIEGRLDPSSFNPEKLKYRLVTEGYLEEICEICGFNERRISDYKMPLILNFKDKNKKNYRKENLQFLCYNCYYLYITDVFTEKQLQGMEDHKPMFKSEVDWELTPYQKERLKELNLGFEDEEEDMSGNEYISRI